MSFNQSRSDKSETQHRKPGRSLSSNQQRGPSGAYGKGGGGPAPSPSSQSNRSFKKSNHNAQGGQSRASVPTVNSSDSNASTPRGVQNGAHVQHQSHGASDAPVTVPAPKQAETSAPQRSSRGVPKAPTSQHATVSSDTTATTTPKKAPDDGSKPVTFQFGSISPGFMNGMQIPARTSSAPPNLDEQKRDQARHNSFRAVPSLPTPNVPKQQLPRKDPGAFDQPNTHEAHTVPKVKKDVQVSPAPPASQTQKPSGLTMPGISVPNPYHQPQVSMQFGGPNQPIPSQGVAASSLQMPQMAFNLPMGSAPQVQQTVFVPSLQSHPMPHQGIMHQGPNMSFTSQMAQMPPPLGNLGISMAPQYSQQPGGKFSAPRKTPVKITNPKTNEEVRFDNYQDGGSSGPRSHPNVPLPSQPIPSFAASPSINYYTTSYNANNLYYSTPSSQAPRFGYPGSQGPQNVTIMNPPALSSQPGNKSGSHMHGILEPPNLERARETQNLVSSVPSGTTQVTIRPGAGSVGQKVEKSELPKPSRASAEVSSFHSPKDPEICTDRSLLQPNSGSDSIVSEAVVMTDPSAGTVAALIVEGQVSTSFSSSFAVTRESVPVITSAESRRKETLSRSNSIKDQQKKQVKKGFSQSQHQAGGQSISGSSMPAQTSEHGLSSESGVSETVESNSTLTPLVTNEGVPKATSELLSTTGAASTDSSVAKAERITESSPSISFEFSGAEAAVDTSGSITRKEEQGENTLSEGPKQDINSLEVSSEHNSLQSVELVIPRLETTRGVMDEPGSCCTEPDMAGDKVVESSAAETSSGLDASSSRGDSKGNDELSLPNSGRLDQQSARAEAIEATKHEGMESVSGGVSMEGDGVSVSQGSKDKLIPELSRTESSQGFILEEAAKSIVIPPLETTRGLMDGSGSRCTEHDTVTEADKVVENFSAEMPSSMDASSSRGDSTSNDQVSLPSSGRLDQQSAQAHAIEATSSEQFTNVPDNFEITADIAEGLMDPNVNASHPGRIIDRPGGPTRLDRRGSGVIDDDRWSKLPSPYGPGRSLPVEVGFGVLRNPRGIQTSVPYVGGLLSGPMQSLGPQGLMQRNSPDSDRWLRATNFHQKGLIPSPQTPLQMMHKTEKKYKVGKVTDEEEVKQRQLKGILNKLTPQNFEKLFQQVKAVNIDNAKTLRGVIGQILDKALMEPTFCEMYANFCYHLSGELPDFSEDNEKITFKRLLLNKCQEEFERGEKEQEEANKADEEGGVKQSEEEREEKRIKARRRMLGTIRLIGELYKKKMSTERIMHECIKKLLGQHQTPEEEDIETLCKLMSSIGEIIDHPKAKEHMDAYFEGMKTLSNNMKLSSRFRFMLKDAIDLRKNKWQQRRKVEDKLVPELSRTKSSAARGKKKKFEEFLQKADAAGTTSDLYMAYKGPEEKKETVADSEAAECTSRSPNSNQVTVDVPVEEVVLVEKDSSAKSEPGLNMENLVGIGVSVPAGSKDKPLPELSRRKSVAQEQQAQASMLVDGDISPGNPREDLTARLDQSSAQEQSINYGDRDLRNSGHSLDRSSSTQNTPTENMWPEEHLRDKSRTAAKEFNRDLKTVSQSSNNSGSRWINFLNKKCKCGKNALLRISESKNNPNRLYYCCVNGENDCGFFEWWMPEDSAQPLDMMTEGPYGSEPPLYENQYPILVQRIVALEANMSVWKTIILLNFVFSMFTFFLLFVY